MNTRPPATDPLDPNELEFARVLRALPGGEPSPALDARILGAARDALAEPAQRRRYGLWTATSGGAMWGIGSAAAAILAVGIVWRVNAPVDNLPPAPRMQKAVVESGEQESTAVDFVEAPGKLAADAGPPPPPPAEPVDLPRAERRQVATTPAPPPPPMVAAAPASAMPEPFADQRADAAKQHEGQANEVGAMSGLAAAPAAAPAPAPSAPSVGAEANPSMGAREYYLSRREAEAKAAAAEDAMAQRARKPDARLEEADAAAAAATDAVTVTGGLIRDEDATTATRQRVLKDAEQAPDEWLAKIRKRLREGDVAGARASLRLYVERYPQRAVPEDLRHLLQQ